MDREDVIIIITLVTAVAGIFILLVVSLITLWFSEIPIVHVLFKIGGTMILIAGFGFLLLGLILYLEDRGVI